MNVLVAFASAHGSTEGIANRIADRLRDNGINVQVEELAGLTNLRGYDAAILGSAIRSGRWLAEGSGPLSRYRGDLRNRPVWLWPGGKRTCRELAREYFAARSSRPCQTHTRHATKLPSPNSQKATIGHLHLTFLLMEVSCTCRPAGA